MCLADMAPTASDLGKAFVTGPAGLRALVDMAGVLRL